jgi:hypothetical protein
MKALTPMMSAILGAIGGTLLTVVGSLIISYNEHRYQDRQWKLSHDEKRIDQKAHLLDEFSTTSSAMVAARSQFLVVDAASNYLNVIQMKTEAERGNKKGAPRDTRLKLESDPDLDGLIKRTIDLKQGLGNKVVEQHAKILSIEVQANIFFGSRIQDAVRALRPQAGEDPFIASPTLDEFKNRFSPEQALLGTYPQESESGFIRRVKADGQADTFEKQCQAIVSAMSAELLLDTTRDSTH